MLNNHISQGRTENGFNNLLFEMQRNSVRNTWGSGVCRERAAYEITGIEKYLHQRPDYSVMLC